MFDLVLRKMPKAFFSLFHEPVSERCTFVRLGMLHAHTFTVAQPNYNDIVKFLSLSTGKAVPLPKGTGRY